MWTSTSTQRHFEDVRLWSLESAPKPHFNFFYFRYRNRGNRILHHYRLLQKGVKHPLADFQIPPDVAIVKFLSSLLLRHAWVKLVAHTGMDALPRYRGIRYCFLCTPDGDACTQSARLLERLAKVLRTKRTSGTAHDAQCLAGIASPLASGIVFTHGLTRPALQPGGHHPRLRKRYVLPAKQLNASHESAQRLSLCIYCWYILHHEGKY